MADLRHRAVSAGIPCLLGVARVSGVGVPATESHHATVTKRRGVDRLGGGGPLPGRRDQSAATGHGRQIPLAAADYQGEPAVRTEFVTRATVP